MDEEALIVELVGLGARRGERCGVLAHAGGTKEDGRVGDVEVGRTVLLDVGLAGLDGLFVGHGQNQREEDHEGECDETEGHGCVSCGFLEDGGGEGGGKKRLKVAGLFVVCGLCCLCCGWCGVSRTGRKNKNTTRLC